MNEGLVSASMGLAAGIRYRKQFSTTGNNSNSTSRLHVTRILYYAYLYIIL